MWWCVVFWFWLVFVCFLLLNANDRYIFHVGILGCGGVKLAVLKQCCFVKQ